MADTDVVRVDDRDNSIKYEGKWGQDGVQEEYDGSTTFTTKKGASARIKFTGTKISVFGTIAGKEKAQKHAPASTYKVDDGLETPFEPDIPGAAQFHYRFFASEDLKEGDHELVITNQVDNGFLFLDYFEIQPAAEKPKEDEDKEKDDEKDKEKAEEEDKDKDKDKEEKKDEEKDKLEEPSTTSSAPSRSIITVINQRTYTTSLPDSTAAAIAAGESVETVGGTSKPPIKNATTIAAGIFGGIVGTALLAAIVVVFWKKRKDKKREEAIDYFPEQTPAWHRKPEYR